VNLILNRQQLGNIRSDCQTQLIQFFNILGFLLQISTQIYLFFIFMENVRVENLSFSGKIHKFNFLIQLRYT
jgi:hypothetical protein